MPWYQLLWAVNGQNANGDSRRLKVMESRRPKARALENYWATESTREDMGITVLKSLLFGEHRSHNQLLLIEFAIMSAESDLCSVSLISISTSAD